MTTRVLLSIASHNPDPILLKQDKTWGNNNQMYYQAVLVPGPWLLLLPIFILSPAIIVTPHLVVNSTLDCHV